MKQSSHDLLNQLESIIRARRAGPAGSSYTRQLLDGGPLKCAKKLGEEAVELALASVGQDDGAVASEAADVLYHLLVLLEVRGVPFDRVCDVLASRVGLSGLDEKAQRSAN